MKDQAGAYLKIVDYVDEHPVAVLSTINDDGTPHAAVIYVFNATDNTLCFITKNLTQKFKNLIDHPVVALTIFDDHNNSTLQLTGEAFAADTDDMLDIIRDKMERVNATRSDAIPPIDKLKAAGGYALVGIKIIKARLAEYQGVGINIEGATFTEITPGAG